MTHLPPLWRVRLLSVIRGKVNRANLQLLAAWARAEGGTARWNPLNTTLTVPGSWPYNSVGVQNFRRPVDGISATAMTLADGYYPGILGDMQAGRKSAHQIVIDHAAEFDKWGTGATHVLAQLP